MVHSFLMIGQSNMAGRGRLEEVPAIENEKLLMLRNGRWQPLREPVNCDRPFAGIGLAPAFADEYAKKFNVETGLIPCADGGSCLDDWAPGGQLWEHAASQTRLAMRVSEVKAILWHQGETDGKTEETACSYSGRFLELIDTLCRAVGLEGIPVIAGELGDFLTKSRIPFAGIVNQELAKAAAKHPRMGLAKAAGLTSNEGTLPGKGLDQLHFDSASYRELGRRYFAVYTELTKS